MRRVRGQGLVETAFILPVLLMAILGVIEAALLIQGYITVQHSARSAARFAASYQPPLGACVDADGDEPAESLNHPRIAKGRPVHDLAGIAPLGVEVDQHQTIFGAGSLEPRSVVEPIDLVLRSSCDHGRGVLLRQPGPAVDRHQ